MLLFSFNMASNYNKLMFMLKVAPLPTNIRIWKAFRPFYYLTYYWDRER